MSIVEGYLGGLATAANVVLMSRAVGVLPEGGTVKRLVIGLVIATLAFFATLSIWNLAVKV